MHCSGRKRILGCEVLKREMDKKQPEQDAIEQELGTLIERTLRLEDELNNICSQE